MVLILVDCTSTNGIKKELLSKFGVTGFPALVYTDPEGKDVGRMSGRGSAALIADLKGITDVHLRKADWKPSLEEALKVGKEKNKPVLLFVADEAHPNTPIIHSFFANPASKDAAKAFALVKVSYDKKSDMLKALGAKKGPSMFVLDPTADSPAAKAFQKIGKVKSPKKFASALEKAAKKWAKAQNKKVKDAAK